MQAKALAVEIYKWIRDIIKSQLQNIKPVQVSFSISLREQSKWLLQSHYWIPTKWRLRDKGQNSTPFSSQIWEELLIGWRKFSSLHYQSEALPRSELWHVDSCDISALVPQTSLCGKPLVGSRNVDCFLRLVSSLRL